MRRLLTWITISITCASVLLVGVRAAHPDSSPTACVQLLSPATGDVLTVDATTGVSRLDARTQFSSPLTRINYRVAFSPDESYFVDAINQSESGPDFFRLWLRRRSTSLRHELTTISHADQYVWSPDSRYLAFTDSRGRNAQGTFINLAIADADGRRVRREAIPPELDNRWINSGRDIFWSPDGTLLALALYREHVGATLMLRPVQTDQSVFVPFPNEEILYITWSPDTQVAVAFTRNTSTSEWAFSVVSPAGQVRKRTILLPNVEPLFTVFENTHEGLRWSPDGQYFFLFEGQASRPDLEIFDLNGDRVLTVPLRLSPSSTLWAAQPHTLVYLQRDQANRQQSLVSLDVATQTITTLVSAIPTTEYLWYAPNLASLWVVATQDADHVAPYRISLDLTTTMPFGSIEYRDPVTPQWSPDGQRVMILSATADTFTLLWSNEVNGEVKHVDLPRQAQITERVYASWLTNDVIIVSLYADSIGQRTVVLLDEQSLKLTPLFTHPITSKQDVIWHDDAYVAITTPTDMLVYRLSDGVAIFTEPSPFSGEVTFNVEPNERALLILGNDATNVGQRSLRLITTTSRQTVMNAGNMTRPTWAQDGEMFALAAIDTHQADWTLYVFSRQGVLLKKFPLAASTNTSYQQVRWTNCD